MFTQALILSRNRYFKQDTYVCGCTLLLKMMA